MQTSELDDDTLRRLAERSVEDGQVISMYLDLDPSRFATAPARSSQIRSLLDQADREARGRDDRKRLRDDLDRVRTFLESGELSLEGAHGLALFCAGAIDLFEAVRLPRPVPSEVVLARRPFLEPLVDMAGRGEWCILLVNRRTGRIFRGSAERMDEVATITDDVRGQHDQGGWSQPRYERSVEKEATDHLKQTADALFRRFKRAPFDRLLIGAPEELRSAVEERLHSYLRERLAGYVDVDVENSSPEAVLAAAAPAIDADDRGRERDALDRLAQGVGGGGRGAAGLEDVLAALNERRVETLLISDGLSAPGVVCPSCGWLGPASVPRCPADGSEVERVDDVTEPAVQLALSQSASVLQPRRFDDLESMGRIGAVLRF